MSEKSSLFEHSKNVFNAFLIGVVFLYASLARPEIPDWLKSAMNNPIVKVLFFTLILVVARIDVYSAGAISLFFFATMILLKEVEYKEKYEKFKEHFIYK